MSIFFKNNQLQLAAVATFNVLISDSGRMILASTTLDLKAIGFSPKRGPEGTAYGPG